MDHEPHMVKDKRVIWKRVLFALGSSEEVMTSELSEARGQPQGSGGNNEPTTTWWVLRMLNMEESQDPAIPLLGRDPQEIKTCPGRNLYIDICNTSIHNSQKRETARLCVK